MAASIQFDWLSTTPAAEVVEMNYQFELNERQASLLKRENTIDVLGEIDIDTALYVREAIQRLRGRGSPPLTVHFTSPGGSVEVGLDLHDMLRLYQGETTGIIFGHAYSMAPVVLQACTIRKCARFATVRLHHVNRSDISLDDMRDRGRLNEIIKNMEKDQEAIYTILSERTGRSIDEMRDVCARDQPMTADEAMAFGLIDEII